MLIGGAAGGVGIFAVQLARIAEARVIGTGSATSADFLRELGASFPIEKIRAAVELQAGRHVKGKIVIDL